MKNTFALLTFLCLYTLSLSQPEIYYRAFGNSEKLNLFSDSTFQYDFRLGFKKAISYGKWFKYKNEIYLRSEKPKCISIESRYNENDKQNANFKIFKSDTALLDYYIILEEENSITKTISVDSFSINSISNNEITLIVFVVPKVNLRFIPLHDCIYIKEKILIKNNRNYFIQFMNLMDSLYFIDSNENFVLRKNIHVFGRILTRMR